jgi:hypothetical protein
MNRIQAYLFVGCVIHPILACKSSHFRGSKAQTEAPTVAEPQPTPSSVPKAPLPIDTEVPIISTPIETSSTDIQLNQSCSKPVQLLMSQVKVSFAKRQKCKFNVEPNKAPIQAFVQAREVSSAVLKLPENSEICTMTLESPADAKLKYDDFIILTIDDFVIFASNKDLVSKLGQTNGLYKWDFLKVRESKINDFKTAAYCIGAADRCKFPGTDTEGAVMLKLNYTEISGITNAIQGKAQVPIELIATGDNNDSPEKMDCYHEALDLTISLNYIKKPK